MAVEHLATSPGELIPSNMQRKLQMDSAVAVKHTERATAPVVSSKLSVNVFTAPGKAMVGERPKPFGEPLAFDPITSTLIFGDNDAVLLGRSQRRRR